MVEQTRDLDRDGFPTPVLIRFGKIGLIHSVSTVDAAEKLLRDFRWPHKGQLNLQARIACIEASEGSGTSQEARAAFVEAAREAGVLLSDG
jgi:hypothetical protein